MIKSLNDINYLKTVHPVCLQLSKYIPKCYDVVVIKRHRIFNNKIMSWRLTLTKGFIRIRITEYTVLVFVWAEYISYFRRSIKKRSKFIG